MLLPSRTACIGSTYNSGEDIATTLASSEVDEGLNLGMLASPLLTQKRGKCSPILDLSLNKGKIFVKFFTRSNQCRETCGGVLTQEKVKSRTKCLARVLF